jgi:hypothetical protein
VPDSFDRDERPTRPDLTSLPCPACRDPKTGKPTGMAMKLEETATGYRSVRAACTLCDGVRLVTRETFDRYQPR